jgi:8-oxo-dGTP diphosphatase
MKIGTLCYLEHDNKMLLLHRNKKENDMHEGMYIGLGGKLIPGETPEGCIEREFYEESGLKVSKLRLRGHITFPKFDGVDDWYVFVFSAYEYSGQLIECPEGTLEWVAIDEVLSKPTWEGDLIFLKWLIENKPFFSANMEYSSKQLEKHSVIFYE